MSRHVEKKTRIKKRTLTSTYYILKEVIEVFQVDFKQVCVEETALNTFNEVIQDYKHHVNCVIHT